MELNKILINSLKCKDASEEFKKLDNNKTLEQLIPKINEMKTDTTVIAILIVVNVEP